MLRQEEDGYVLPLFEIIKTRGTDALTCLIFNSHRCRPLQGMMTPLPTIAPNTLFRNIWQENQWKKWTTG